MGDENMPGWFVATLKAMLVCYGPKPSQELLDRLRGLGYNCMETEPWGIALAVAYGLKRVLNIYAFRYAEKLLWAFCAARIGHTVCFLFAVPQPGRAVCWTLGTFSMILLASLVLI